MLKRARCFASKSSVGGLAVVAMFLAAGLGGRGGMSISPFLKAMRAAIKSSRNWYDFCSYCGFATHPLPPLGKTNLCLATPTVVWACARQTLWLWSRIASWVRALTPW